MGYYSQAIERISVIDWSRLGEEETVSQSYLCREYLRRAAKFLKDYPGTCVPFYYDFKFNYGTQRKG